uniref:hypothetical protein n=1 Tax=Staphylococcus aureus TaxID=1280 RepID=UPI0020BD7941
MIEALMTWIENYMQKREERRKGVTHEFEFCHKCKYVHEYRLHERKVFLRCRSCRHVYLKRDMTAREHTDMLNYQLQLPEVVSDEPARMGATQMVNDGKHFLSNKERSAYIQYCENMTQF